MENRIEINRMTNNQLMKNAIKVNRINERTTVNIEMT